MIEVDCSYPEHDFPWTHYFNGVPMPRWSNCGHLVPMLERAEDFMRDWDEFVGFPHLWRLQCRMDHCGVVESEQPDIFRLCCLTLAFVLLRDEVAILDSLAAEGAQYGGTPSEVFTGVRDGLFAMHHRCLEDGIAFWTSGYETDRDFLRDSIRRNHLPQTDPDWLEAPHVQRNRSETELRISFIRRDIIALIGTRQFPKDVRRLIHELPRNA